MKKKKYRRRNRRRLPLILVTLFLLSCILCGCFAAWKKPDWFFLIREQTASLFRSAPLREISPDELNLTAYTREELLSDPDLCQFSTELLLVNEEHPISREYTASLALLGNNRDGMLLLEETALADFDRLSTRVEQDCGTALLVRSSYRTYEEQAAEKEAQPAIAAAAGASEHETGLALDVYVPYFSGYGFLKSEAGQYVYSHSWETGFVIRYPYGKKKLTGIPFEPWHLRYVGCPHAEIMYKNAWTLEEYLDQLEYGTYYQFGEYFISRQKGETMFLPGKIQNVRGSDDNCGGIVFWGILNQQEY
ncbi:MAG: M15 family metallopeptidase [Fusicatenibacter sp.]|nr:M15 family metallopeptidase [Fusicatenibacter sp.]